MKTDVCSNCEESYRLGPTCEAANYQNLVGCDWSQRKCEVNFWRSSGGKHQREDKHNNVNE
ncbi:MAG: hypothetical protein CBB71_08550 [Rhodopirellula sp. TMED11]|nr:MAG: hypothetical protein CBB71_08550 [Rhodopirellula sp. TMED11]